MRSGKDSLSVDYAESVAAGVPMFGPLIAPIAKRLAAVVLEEHARNASVALKVAERVSGLSREDLEERIADDGRLVPLTTRVLFAAAMCGADSTLRLMGGLLGHVVREPERADAAEDLLASVDRLRDGHIATLRVVASPPPEVPDQVRTWTEPLVAERLGDRGEYAAIYLAGLSAAGLVYSVDALDFTIHRLSSMGRALIEVMDAIAEAERT